MATKTQLDIPAIKENVRAKMGGTLDASGMPILKRGPRKYTKLEDWRAWGREMYAWNIRVRRDILMLEEYLKATGDPHGVFYGDPGDPPPPPDEFA